MPIGCKVEAWASSAETMKPWTMRSACCCLLRASRWKPTVEKHSGGHDHAGWLEEYRIPVRQDGILALAHDDGDFEP